MPTVVGGRKDSLLPTPVALPAIERRRLEHDLSLSLSLPPMASNVGTPSLAERFRLFQCGLMLCALYYSAYICHAPNATRCETQDCADDKR